MAETKRTVTADGSIIYSWMGKMHCWEDRDSIYLL